MISKYTQLTGRYLKASKKRTVLTVIGIILSVSLISSIGLFMKGIQSAEIESVKTSEGAAHLIFTHVDQNLYNQIKDNPKVGRYGYISSSKGIKIGESISIKEISGTKNALNLLPHELKKGKMPSKRGEAIVEQWVLDSAFKGKKIGDSIHFRNKTFVLVGILKNNSDNQFYKKGALITKDDSNSESNRSLYVEVNQKANLRTAVDELKKLTKKNYVKENSHLLIVEGAAKEGSPYKGVYSVVAIVIAIVLISTIAVIYNSFQISVVERIKQFGLLRAVGTTPKQIRKIVLKEATILACIGIPFGLFFGVVAIFGIDSSFRMIGGDTVNVLRPSIDPPILIGSGFIGFISVYLSALFPSILAGRISPLVAISSRNAITKEKIKKRKYDFVRKMVGFEAFMALKNIKRNRKRYRITVFSIVISVTLFITFKSFMDMTMNVSPPPNASEDINFSLYFNKNSGMNDQTFHALKDLKDTQEIYKNYDFSQINAYMDPKKEISAVKKIDGIYQNKNINGAQKTIINSSVDIYDEDSLKIAKRDLKDGNLNSEKLNQEDGVILVEKDTIFNNKTGAKYVGPVANLLVGDEIEIQYPDQNGKFDNQKLKKVKILAVLKDAPFQDSGNSSGIMLITTQKAAENLSGSKVITPTGYSIKIKQLKNEARAEKSIQQVIAGKKEVNLVNNIDQNRRDKSNSLMIQILLYGFVIVVSLIGSVNIINTITTNILLRKGEFAALKSIGLTQKGLRKMIVVEGLLYSIFGTVYGSIIASILSFLMYRGFQGVREFSWSVPWTSIVFAGIVSLIIGYISVLSPLSRIKKDNIIDTIREDY